MHCAPNCANAKPPHRGAIPMFESFAQLFPADWQGAVLTLLAPMRWLAAWQSSIALAWAGGFSTARTLAFIVLLMPSLLIAAGMWCTVASIYTCLLYTSDAADERSSVDLGGRR